MRVAAKHSHYMNGHRRVLPRVLDELMNRIGQIVQTPTWFSKVKMSQISNSITIYLYSCTPHIHTYPVPLPYTLTLPHTSHTYPATHLTHLPCPTPPSPLPSSLSSMLRGSGKFKSSYKNEMHISSQVKKVWHYVSNHACSEMSEVNCACSEMQ